MRIKDMITQGEFSWYSVTSEESMGVTIDRIISSLILEVKRLIGTVENS